MRVVLTKTKALLARINTMRAPPDVDAGSDLWFLFAAFVIVVWPRAASVDASQLPLLTSAAIEAAIAQPTLARFVWDVAQAEQLAVVGASRAAAVE